MEGGNGRTSDAQRAEQRETLHVKKAGPERKNHCYTRRSRVFGFCLLAQRGISSSSSVYCFWRFRSLFAFLLQSPMAKSSVLPPAKFPMSVSHNDYVVVAMYLLQRPPLDTDPAGRRVRCQMREHG